MADAERVTHATRSFLEDHPDAEHALHELVELDRDTSGWEFEEIPLDSGRFGELVSREIAIQTDNGYQLADREAVQSALQDETVVPAETPTTDETQQRRTHSLSLPSVNWSLAVVIAAALSLVAVARSLHYDSVFQSGLVVSPANDSYFYRYHQATLLDLSDGLADFGMVATVGEETRIRPLTHALNWWFGELVGPDMAAAWVPVVAAVVLAAVVYGQVIRLTSDHRMGLASVLLFALTPVHVVYTGLGFLEHRPYQYLWLGLTVFALVWLATDLQRRLQTHGGTSAALAHARSGQAWGVAGLLAVALAGTAHVWGGSPLSFIPVALYILLRVAVDTRRDIPALPANAPALGGLSVGAALAVLAHVRWDWHEAIAVSVPAIVAAGAIGVAVLATIWDRLELPVWGLLGTEVVTLLAGAWLYRRLRPEDVARLQERSNALFGRETATETASLFTTDQVVIFGPLFQIGLGFYFALIPLGLATWYAYRRYEPGWLVVVVFAWVWLVLASIQVRFAAQFSIFCAVFGGVGLVYLLGAVDLVRKPDLFGDSFDGPPLKLPSAPKKTAYLAAIIIVALLANLIFVPTLLGQVQYSDEQTETTLAIADHAESLNQEYPQNFVLSQWGSNRMYNYFVNGESQGYGYARANHESFIVDNDSDAYYDQFSGRVGYLMLVDRDLPDETVHTKLFDEYGAGEDTVAHYQLIHATDDTRAFALVPGAVIQANASTNETITASTNVFVGDTSFTYERNVTAENNGTVRIRVAYPGTYDVAGESVTVTESDIQDGASISVERSD